MNKKKNIAKLTDSNLKRIVSESIKKVLKEGYDSNPLYRNYHNVIDACGSIILQNQAKGRRFVPQEIGELQNDPQFMQFRQELLESLEGYFDATKQLLSYVANKCREDGETSLVDTAQKWIDRPFTPEW